ncbi:hypothetical protein FO519_002128 [Halicephalobus sp. NKZ332]|nr:hypothetical protein FO519_002128 [Halicephalobus sp. NKZ332]
MSKLNSLNISLDDLNTVNMSGNCKSNDDYCSNGTWCAKRTVTYNINFNGMKYDYHTTYKTCMNQRPDTNSQPEDGKCYDDTTEANTDEDGITRKAQWCYCKNKDFCNSSTREIFSFSLITMFLIITRLF